MILIPGRVGKVPTIGTVAGSIIGKITAIEVVTACISWRSCIKIAAVNLIDLKNRAVIPLEFKPSIDIAAGITA